MAADNASIPAGDFSVWLHETREALRTGAAADVPCGTCTACCTSSYFIHIGPDETDTLAHVGKEGLIPAVGMPRGHMLMGYDQEGLCPQMSQVEAGRCAVYAHRPQTCRRYDCRVFTAAGLDAGDDKPRINARVKQWRFNYPTDCDRAAHEAVREAARFIQENSALFPGGKTPQAPSQLATLAIRVSELFAEAKASGKSVSAPEMVKAIVEASRSVN